MIGSSCGADRLRGHVNEIGVPVTGTVVQARDVHGGIHIHHRPPTPLPVPRQLPGPGRLVDREDVLAELDRVGGSHDVLLVSGSAGIGKTTVALHWAHANVTRFPDGQLHADLQGHAAVGPVRPSEILGRFIRALGLPDERIPSGLAERAALYRSLAAGRRLLIFLDDAHSAAQVGPLLPGTPGAVAVVTSRWRLAGLVARGARAVHLGPLGPDAALELLRVALGAERVEVERDMAARLVDQCERSPLALSLAAARLAARPRWRLAELVRALTQERRRLAVLSAQDPEDDVTIRAALRLSYDNLPEPVRRLYRMLGLHPGTTFDTAMAAALADAPVAEVGEWLGVLTDANLLDDLPGGRYRFHDLVRLHALETAEALDPEDERRAAVRRLAEAAVLAALAAGRVIAPYRRLPDPGFSGPEPPVFADAAAAIDWLDEEFGNLRAIAARAHELGWHRQSWWLVDAAWPLFAHRGHHVERLEFDRTGLAAARADGDATAEAKMLNRTGLALRELGRLDEAARDFTAALRLWRRLDVPHRVAGARRRLGLLHSDGGDLDAAAEHFSSAVDVYDSLGEHRRAARTRCDLGAVLIRLGRAADAVAVLTEAERALESASDPYTHARALLLLGQAHAEGHPPDAAVRFAERGLAAMRAIGSAIGEADALHVLGDLAVRDGQVAEARRHYTAARRILAGTGASTRILDRRLAELADRD